MCSVREQYLAAVLQTFNPSVQYYNNRLVMVIALGESSAIVCVFNIRCTCTTGGEKCVPLTSHQSTHSINKVQFGNHVRQHATAFLAFSSSIPSTPRESPSHLHEHSLVDRMQQRSSSQCLSLEHGSGSGNMRCRLRSGGKQGQEMVGRCVSCHT